jgi:hypothetical protein
MLMTMLKWKRMKKMKRCCTIAEGTLGKKKEVKDESGTQMESKKTKTR